LSSERIFNIFVYFEDGTAREYGMRHYRLGGSEKNKLAFLQSKVDTDCAIARHFLLTRPITYGEWSALQRLGIDLEFFEEGFREYRAGRKPLFCITSIVDGFPRVDLTTDPAPFVGSKMNEMMPGDMEDWITKYAEGKKFRMDKLINDDYFEAIRILFNSRHFVSASKLLMSCIDTIAFVEYGDNRGNFTKWLDTFVELEPLNITAVELWEFRNSVIHMTNLNSRAVLAGKVSPIAPCVGSAKLDGRLQSFEMKWFDLYELIQAIALGVTRWGETYNADTDKFLKFVERYDTMISDSRVGVITV